MVHPAISFLMGTYSNVEETARTMGLDKESIMVIGSNFLNVLNEGYVNYQEKKPSIDKILNDIYELHNGTLCIGTESGSRNRLTAFRKIKSPVDDAYFDACRHNEGGGINRLHM